MGLPKPAGGGVAKDGIHLVGGKGPCGLFAGKKPGIRVFTRILLCPFAGEVLGEAAHRCFGQ